MSQINTAQGKVGAKSSEGTNVEQSQQFFALSAYIAELTQNKSIQRQLSSEEADKLQALMNSMLEYLSQIPKGIIYEGSNSRTQQSSVFRLLFYANSLIQKACEKQARAQTENETQKKRTQAANQDAEIISRLSRELHLKGVNSESDFVTQINMIQESKQQIIDDLIETFNLSPKANALNIIDLMKEKFEHITSQQFALDGSDASNQNTVNQKIQECCREIEELKSILQEREEEIEEKDSRIEELESEAAEMQGKINIADQMLNANGIVCSQLEKAKAEVVSMQINFTSVQNKYEKKKQQNIALRDTINQIDDERNNMQIKYETLLGEVEQLKKKVADTCQTVPSVEYDALNKKMMKAEEDKQQLLALLDDFTDQFQQQAQELAEETNNRISLVAAVQKLSLVNQELEKQITRVSNEAKAVKQNQQANPVKAAPVENIKDDSCLKTIENLSKIAANCKNCEISKVISNLSNDTELTSEEKIEHIITSLIGIVDSTEKKNADEIKSVKQTNSALATGFSSILKFIEKLANSGDIMAWSPKASSPEEARATLLIQSTRINNFLFENAPGLIEESHFFECLSLDNNYTDFEKKMSEIFDSYPTLQTDEGRQMFLLLTQAIVANDVLRRFANEAKIQCSHQSAEIKVIKNEAEMASKEIEGQYYDELIQLQNQLQEQKQKYDDLMELTGKIKVVLQNASTKNANSAEILESIQNINEKQPALNENEYISELEKVLEAKTKEYISLKEESEATIQNLQEIANKYKEEVQELNQKAEIESTEQMKEIEVIKETLDESQDLINRLKQENEFLQQQASSSKDETIKATADLRKQLYQTTADLDSLHDEYDSAISKAESENNQLNKQLKDAMVQIENVKQQYRVAAKKKIAQLKDNYGVEMQKKAEEIAHNEEMIEELNSILEENQTKIATMNETIHQLNETLKDQNETLEKLQLDQKMMKTKLMSRDETIKRDKSVFDTQMKLKLFAVETNAQAKIDAIRIESNKRSQELLDSIFSIVNSVFETIQDDSVEPVINEESIKYMIEEICEKAKKSDDLLRNSKQCQEELDTIKTALGVSKATKATIAITDLVKQIQNQASELTRINEENQQMKKDIVHVRSVMQQERIAKEWEDWARKLHFLVNDGFCSVKSAKEIRFAVEEIVFAAVNNRLVWRRLDTLRAEKKFIIKGIHKIQSKKLPATLQHLLQLSKFVLRLQKLSGHSKTELTYERSGEFKPKFRFMKQQEDKKTDTQQSSSHPIEKSPLFTKFIVSNKSNENVNIN